MTRRDDAFVRIKAGEYRRPPEKQAVRDALKMLTDLPQWQVLLDYLRHREWEATAQSDTEDAGALLRAAGRRSLLREIERMDGRLTDDDRNDQRE